MNVYDEVFRRTGVDNNSPCGSDWEGVPGAMIYVSTAEEGVVWAIDDEHDLWILKTGTISVVPVIRNDEWDWIEITDIELV